MCQQILGISPSIVFFTNKIFNRDFNIREPNLVYLSRTIQQDDWSHFDSGGIHVDQKKRNSRLLFDLAVGAYKAEYHIGVLAKGGPRFLTIHNVIIAFSDSFGFQRSKVRPSTRFRVTLTPPILTRKYTG